MLVSIHPPEGICHNRYFLIDQLKDLGYTEDSFGKRTNEMTLPELQQIYINLEYQRETALKG